MKLPALLASDLHLTSNPADEYRWGLFQWLAKQAVAERAKTIVLCGDLTDAKDYHSSELVNRLVQSIKILTRLSVEVVIVRGNHDYLRDGHMFFEFLSALPNVRVITSPTADDDENQIGEPVMYLPFTRTPLKDWTGFDLSHYAYVFMHQTVDGAVSESGQVLEGEPKLQDILKFAGKVYSGDIHVPQKIGCVEYIGSPYHVHFGDNFKPRVIVIESNKNAVDLHFPSPRRIMLDVSGPDAFAAAIAGLQEHDQVKVRVSLSEADKHRWRPVKAEIEKWCEECGQKLVSIELRVEKSKDRVLSGDLPAAEFDPVEATYRYVNTHGLGYELLEAALECIKG